MRCRLLRLVTIGSILSPVALWGLQSHPPKEPERRGVEQRGADSTPIVVKLLNNGVSEKQAAEDAVRSRNEHQLTESLVGWTKILGVATAILALFTIGLWWVTRGTLKHLEREFVASHRPKLRIRQVRYTDPPAASVPVIAAVVTNIGDSDSTIIEARGTDWDITVGSGQEASIPNSVLWSPIAGLAELTLKSGQSAPMHYRRDIFLRRRYSERAELNKTIMFWCVVKYRDISGTLRESSTFRVLRIGAAQTQFQTLGCDGADYEYED